MKRLLGVPLIAAALLAIAASTGQCVLLWRGTGCAAASRHAVFPVNNSAAR